MVQVVAKTLVKELVEDILVVGEFPDSFIDDYLRLPSAQEIDFAIGLEPRTALVHKALFRMAPTKLKDLKHNFRNW